MSTAASSSCWLLILGAVVWLAACKDDDAGPKDTDVERDDTGDTGGKPSTPWTVAVMPGEGEIASEPYIRIASSPSDDLAVAYFLPIFNDGECSELNQEPPLPDRNRYDLRLATKAAGGDWRLDTVDEPVYFSGPRGISLTYNDAGAVMVAYAGGAPDPDGGFCVSGDAYLAINDGSGWDFEVAGTMSGDSPSDQPESQAGAIVGFWPALALDANQRPALVHQDVHFLHAGENRNDAEFAMLEGGGWTHEVIDPGTGAGNGNALMFDSSNRPIAFYAIPINGPNHGVWAARRNDSGEWERIKVHDGAIEGSISAALDPEFQEPVAAMYVYSQDRVKVVRLLDDERFMDSSAWNTEYVGQNGFAEGTFVSMRFSPLGNMALAYYRCRRNSDTKEKCNMNDDGLVFAMKKAGAWSYQVVDDGDKAGECGTYASLAFTSDGTAHIGYLCNLEHLGERTVSLYVASKKIEDVK